MDAQKAMQELLDDHYDVLAMNRRQLADLAGVNAGQLSNWLRNAGPLSAEKEGRVAQMILEKVENHSQLQRFAQVLRYYGPRRRLLATKSEEALAGRPIFLDNPLYIKRYSDFELEYRLRSDRIQLEINGGAKVGKSSLLLTAQRLLESSWTVLVIDFKDYEPGSGSICGWMAVRLEEQIGGHMVVVWTERDDAVPWVLNNVLPNAMNRKAVLVIDHVDCLLPPQQTEVGYVVKELLINRPMFPGLINLGIIAAVEKTLPGTARLDQLWVEPFSEHEFVALLKAHGVSCVSSLQEAYQETLGDAFDSQQFCVRRK